MRIAIVSSCAVSVPPAAYGGTELFVAALAGALIDRGHDVFVYATGDSRPPGKLRYCITRPVWPPNVESETRHALWAWADIRTLHPDVVHLNSSEALEAWNCGGPPPVLTIHHRREQHLVELYRRYPDIQFVAISHRQATLVPELSPLPVVHHGVDPSQYAMGAGNGGYCAFLGRIAPEKAPHLAIDAARRAGVDIVIGAPHWKQIPACKEYFDREMRTRLSRPGVHWFGELNKSAKIAMLQGAEALLVPMDWEEPFGLVMIEAMLVGTPVIAFERGSAPEIVENGITGYVVRDVESMSRVLPAARQIDRSHCRRHAVERFSASRMAAEYEAIYATRTCSAVS